MPDDQGTSNDVVEEGADADYDGNDGNDINDIIGTTTPPAQIIDDGGNSVVDDDVEDEPLPDVTVNLYINDEADGLVIPNDLVNAGLTDEYGNLITPTTPSLSDSINDYTASISQGVYDELTTNGTNIGGKQWWGKFDKQKYHWNK